VDGREMMIDAVCMIDAKCMIDVHCMITAGRGEVRLAP
jgi:hypothetical protein